MRLSVLGAGSWGTAIADLLARKGFDVGLWVREKDLCESIRRDSENGIYLPGVRLTEGVKPSESMEEALRGSVFIVSAIPSHGVREVFKSARPFIAKDSIIVSTTKGIEEHTDLTPSSILREVLEGVPYGAIAVLSGPSFAREVSLRMPTAVCAASASVKAADSVQRTFSTHYFRVYTNTDVTGVELGGALKNVIAIASGISDGLALGNNARAALITRGLSEISRLGVRLGANPGTFYGLSGLGDLVLTCTGALSRNYSVGFQIGKGKSLDEILKGMAMVAEGVRTSKAVLSLSMRNDTEMPITREVCNVLYEGKSPKGAVLELMTRGLKSE